MSYVGNTPTTQGFSPAVDYFSGNGSTTSFTLSRPVASVAQIQVVVNNVPQNPSTAYTVSSNTITFTGAPSTGTNNIYVEYTSPITQVIQPGSGTVGVAQLSATGTASSSTYLRGDNSWASISTGPTGVSGQAFTANGTFTIPSGVTALKVTVVGGGGGGGSFAACTGGGAGGGAGAAAIKYLTGLTPGNTLAVTVGALGTTASSGGTSSVASGTQSITTITATGGAGGSYNVGGAGGSASGGDINSGGGSGGPQVGANGGSTGGGSIFGTGGRPVNGSAAVSAATAYGAGGGGGGSIPGFGTNGYTGGSGAVGIVFFEW